MKKCLFMFVFCWMLFSLALYGNDSTEVARDIAVKEEVKETTVEDRLARLPWWEHLIVASMIGIGGYIWKKLIDKSVDNALNTQKDESERDFKRYLADQKISYEEKVRELEERIQTSFNEKQQIIDKTFEDTTTEVLLWKNKKIKVFGEEDTTILKQVLKRAKFNINEHLIEQDDTDSNYDVLFINNVNGEVDLDEALEVVKNLPPHVLTFYYTSRYEPQYNFQTRKLDITQYDKVNFAKSAAQIYGNLLNTLKYQDKIAKSL